ncbi:MAG: gspL [Nevskia sp.]|nr:gspL [Nevskia sp.]
MRETLYLRLRELAPPAATAYAITVGPEAGASVFVREAPLADVVAQAQGRRVVAFVSGADVRLSQIRVPARQPAKVLQAAPFVLEDQFAEDVETLHFALGTRQPDGAFPVATASRESMDSWLAPFRDAGVSIDALVPETLALPFEPGVWSVLAEPRHMTVRSSICGGFCCLPEEFEIYLQLADGSRADPTAAPEPMRILMTHGAAGDFTRLPRPVELIAGFQHPLEALVRNLRLSQAINLLQGSYSQREQFDRLWQPWRLAAIVAGIAFVLGLTVNGVEAWRLKHAANAQDAANLERFYQLFPNEGRNVNYGILLEQKEQQMHGAPTAGGLLYLVQQCAQALAATPGLTLKTLQFREGALFLDLGGSDLQVLEKLRAWFTAHGGAKLEVQSANAGEGGVQIRLKLSAA